MSKKHKLKVKLVVSGYVHELIKKLHQEYPNKERSGIARIEKMDGYYMMTDIRFPKQSNHGAETEIKDGGLDELLEDIFTNNPEQLHERKCWIHSHHHMGVFRSGTDDAARRSFNDGNLDFRWSVVTAYDKNFEPTYKCALTVFKPIDMEFTIPVSSEPFDLQSYMQMFGQDYQAYVNELKELEAERDAALEALEQEYEPSQSDIQQMVEIFNVEGTAEDLELIVNLIKKEHKANKKNSKQQIHEWFEEHSEDLMEKYQMDYFSDKLKELEENIIAPPVYTQKPWNSYSQTNGLFDAQEIEDDIKYKNHTKPDLDRSKPFNYGQGYGYGRDY